MKFEERYEVTSHAVDRNDHIRPTSLVRYMQETADHQMRDEKPSYSELFYEGKALILTRMSVQIDRQLHEYDKIRAHTWCAGSKATTLLRCYDIIRDGEAAARAYSEWGIVDHRNGTLRRADEIDMSNYSTDEPLKLDLPRRFRFPKDLEFRDMGVHRVRYSECDMNRHMNNANYLNLLWDLIPDIWDWQVTSLNTRFMKEAKMGAEIRLSMTEIDPALTGDPAAEKAYAFRTTVDGKTNVENMMGLAPVTGR